MAEKFRNMIGICIYNSLVIMYDYYIASALIIQAFCTNFTKRKVVCLMMKKFVCLVMSMIVLFTCQGMGEEISEPELFLTSLSVIRSTDEGSIELPVLEFAAENPKRDYYFGLEEMPESIEALPEVSAVSNMGEVSVGYDFEPGGYVAEIVISYESQIEKYRLHFREIESAVLAVSSYFSVKSAYIREEKDKFNVISNEYGYAGFDLNSLPENIILTEAVYSARNAYNPEPVTMGYSHYSSLAELRADIQSNGGRNKDFTDEFDVIGTNPIDSSTSRFSCSFLPDFEKIVGGNLLLIFRKDSGNVSYFYESQLAVKYIKKEYSVSDEITMGSIQYSGSDGQKPVISEGNNVELIIPVEASPDNQNSKSYALFSLCYCNGKLVDSEIIYNTIEPGNTALESMTLTIGENPTDFSIVTLMWDSIDGMNPMVYSQEYYGE